MTMMKRIKSITILQIQTAILTISLLFFGTIFMLKVTEGGDVVTFFPDYGEILTPMVNPGGILTYKIHFYKHKPIEADIRRVMHCSDGRRFQVGSEIKSNVEVGETRAVVNVTIPADMRPSNDCYIETQATYQANPLAKKVVERGRTGLFDVVVE